VTRFRRNTLLAFGVCMLLAALIAGWALRARRSNAEILADARKALASEDYERARRLAEELLERDSDSSDALRVNAEASLHLGDCADAETSLQQLVKKNDGDLEAHRSLMRLMKMEGRFREIRRHALALLRAGDSGNEFLMVLAAPDGIGMSQPDRQFAESCHRAVPDDPLPMLGIARLALQRTDFKTAQSILREITATTPSNLEAQALRGTVLLQTEDADGFVEWHKHLPAGAEKHPEIWFLRGAWARRTGQDRAAVRCFWESIRRDPNHARACFQLSQLLVLADKRDRAKPFADRFKTLEEVSRLATRGNDSAGGKPTAGLMDRISMQMEKLGRLWEAVGWCRMAIQYEPQFPGARTRLERLTSRLDGNTPLTPADANPANAVDFSECPLPTVDSSAHRRQSGTPSSNPAISFVDRAKSLGLAFRFDNGAEPASGRARMFEFSGGGAAVLDYDGDYWPDLYLTQGCSWPPNASEQHRDRLFRNVGGNRFEDVTDESGLGDRLYGQGAAIGDFDNDGFPDIYLGNIGTNRLYHNNGDGTFSEVTDAGGIAGHDWTLSCLLADVNGDGLPDIYCVNYLSGNDVFTRACVRNGRPVQCPLHYFPSAQDRLYLNLGDGRFQDVTETSGIAIPDGKGMGIVAADFHRRGRVSLFIANDDKPNFFFVNQATGHGQSVRFSNRAVQSGLAFGDLGNAQSCMGVAAGDANNDGLLDLFVTNYAREPNNLYVQRPGGTFDDVCRRAGLYRATLSPMGWGTQFIDGDLDGLLDLVVANGHLDRNTARPGPYKMPAQFFYNLGNNRFTELPAHQLGPYFQRRTAGRAVARIDWNRDGANDVCVTHVEEPVALLTNGTTKRGHFLNVHLRGVRGSRDAIGSVVRIKSGGRTWYRHLTAGDGFQASNERMLNFGFGGRNRIDELTVFWNSGRVQTIPGMQVDCEVLLVEGMPSRRLAGHD
jgi:thioredoxin-like negative regulator of GroEL